MKILIIGQGIAGTWLSYWFWRKGAEVVVMDEERPNTSSRIASGVINPVTGRQVVTTWLADVLLPFSQIQYEIFGNEIGEQVIKDCGILAFPPSEQMQNAYSKRLSEASPYVHPLAQDESYSDFFNFFYKGVKISPAYWVDVQTILQGWRQMLSRNEMLLEEKFDESELQLHDKGIVYKEIEADFIFYCNGFQSENSTFWNGLPFASNKGEAIIVDIPGLPYDQIYKFGNLTLVPWHNGLWWAGSTYDNSYLDDQPTENFRLRTCQFLEQILKLPYNVEGHLAAIRPTTVERRPFVGLHPNQPVVGILGGLGTKGVSLAPWFSHQLANHILYGKDLEPAADVRRYKRAFASL